jgi:hypothetical protein
VVVVVPELEEQDGEANDEDDEVDRDDDDEPDDEYDEAEEEEEPDEADGVLVGARFSLTPKMRDEFASLPYVRVAGPLEGASTREHEQAHQFPKFIAHHRSSRQPSLVHKTLAKTLSLHATIADERAEQLEARRATKASQFVPFKDGERVAVPDWLQVRGVTRTFACNGFHLGTHRLYLFDFIVVTARLMDGVVRDVHGVLERSVRCTAWRDNAPQREQWVLFMREYDCVRDAGTDSWRVTPCRTARRDQQLAIFSSQVIAIERRFVIKHNDNEDGRRVWFVCKRAPPLRVTIQPRDALRTVKNAINSTLAFDNADVHSPITSNDPGTTGHRRPIHRNRRSIHREPPADSPGTTGRFTGNRRQVPETYGPSTGNVRQSPEKPPQPPEPSGPTPGFFTQCELSES